MSEKLEKLRAEGEAFKLKHEGGVEADSYRGTAHYVITEECSSPALALFIKCDACGKDSSVSITTNPRSSKPSYASKFKTHACSRRDSANNPTQKRVRDDEDVGAVTSLKKRKPFDASYFTDVVAVGDAISTWIKNDSPSKEDIAYRLCTDFEEYGITFDFGLAVEKDSVDEERCFLKCVYCSTEKEKQNFLWLDISKSGSIVRSVILHLGFKNEAGTSRVVPNKGSKHIVNSKQGRLIQFGFVDHLSARVSLRDFTSETRYVAARCCTFRPDFNDKIESEVHRFHPDVTVATHYSIDNNVYIIDKVTGKGSVEHLELQGGYRSLKCAKVSCFKGFPFPDFTCISCRLIKTSRQYVRQIRKRIKDTRTGVIGYRPFKYDFQDNKPIRMQRAAKSNKLMYLLLLNKSKKLHRLMVKQRDVVKRWERMAPVGEVVHDLVLAWERGLLKDTSLKFNHIKDSLKNMLRRNGGQRHGIAMKRFAAASKITSGLRGLNHVKNLYQISDSTVDRFIKKHRAPFKGGLLGADVRDNMAEVGKQLVQIVKEREISPELIIPAVGSTDETPILRKGVLTVDVTLEEGNSFKVTGMCCEWAGTECTFGNTPGSKGLKCIEDINDAYKRYRSGGNISVYMLSWLHPDLKDIPVVCAVNCNRFPESHGKDFYEEIFVPAFAEILGPVLGYKYPIGLISDGDARRSRTAYDSMDPYKIDLTADRFQFPHPCVPLVAKLHITQAGLKQLHGIFGSDTYHILKNFANLADSSTRTLVICDKVIAVGRIRAAINKGQAELDDMTDIVNALCAQGSLDRPDKMDVRAVQDLISMRVQTALKERIDNGNPDDAATLWYIDIMLKFRMMYIGIILPIELRIEYCAYIVTSLFIWYDWILANAKKGGPIHAKKSFITMATFRNIILACNCWLLILVAVREGTNLDCFTAWKIGSNNCEILFALLCGFGAIEAGKRDANFEEILRLLSNTWLMTMMEGDPDEGFLKKFSRARKHDPERSMMEIDEEKLLEISGILKEGVTQSIKQLNTENIKALLDIGKLAAFDAASKLGCAVLADTEHKGFFAKYYKRLSFKAAKKKNSAPVSGEDSSEEEDTNGDVPDDELPGRNVDTVPIDAELLLRFVEAGCPVEARYCASRFWIQGLVIAKTKVNDEHVFTIKYIDGTIEENVKSCLIRPFKAFQYHDEVWSVFGNSKNRFYLAIVTNVLPDGYVSIRFHDTGKVYISRRPSQIARHYYPGDIWDFSDLIERLPTLPDFVAPVDANAASSETDGAATRIEQVIIDDSNLEALVEQEIEDTFIHATERTQASSKSSKRYLIGSRNSSETFDARRYHSVLSHHFSTKLSHDRMKKLYLTTKLNARTSLMDKVDQHLSFGIGSWVNMKFVASKAPNGWRFYPGQVVKMHRLVGNKWLPFHARTAVGSFKKGAIQVECVWWGPVPQDGETAYSASVYSQLDSTRERRYHSGPRDAELIVCCPDMYFVKGTTSTYQMDAEDLQYTLEDLVTTGMATDVDDNADDDGNETDSDEDE